MMKPERCPGYTCPTGQPWMEAHRDDPVTREPHLPPDHFWYEQGGYLAHYPPSSLTDGVPNKPACAAAKNWPLGYLPCGCHNDGTGRHVYR